MTPKERTSALKEGLPVDRVPVQPITMSFAARYAGVPFGRYVQDYRELASAQLKLLEDFDLDLVTLCSDPCREAADCGAKIFDFEDQPPTPDTASPRIARKEDLAELRLPDPLGGGRMHDRVKATEVLAREAGDTVPVLGWIEGPIAEAADLRGLRNIFYDVALDHSFLEDLFGFVIEMETQFARAQIEAGADWIGIGDAAASLVDPENYRKVVLPAEKELVSRVKELGAKVRVHICGKIDHLLPGMSELDMDMVDIDSPTDIGLARKHIGAELMILGNLDPVKYFLNSGPQDVVREIENCAEKVGDKYVVGAGCEIPPGAPSGNVKAMVEAGGLLAEKLRQRLSS